MEKEIKNENVVENAEVVMGAIEEKGVEIMDGDLANNLAVKLVVGTAVVAVAGVAIVCKNKTKLKEWASEKAKARQLKKIRKYAENCGFKISECDGKLCAEYTVDDLSTEEE